MSSEKVTETPLSLGPQSLEFLSGSAQSKSQSNPSLLINKIESILFENFQMEFKFK